MKHRVYLSVEKECGKWLTDYTMLSAASFSGQHACYFVKMFFSTLLNSAHMTQRNCFWNVSFHVSFCNWTMGRNACSEWHSGKTFAPETWVSVTPPAWWGLITLLLALSPLHFKWSLYGERIQGCVAMSYSSWQKCQTFPSSSLSLHSKEKEKA